MQNTISFHNDASVGPRFMHISNASLAVMAQNFGYKLDPDARVQIIGNERRMYATVKLPQFGFDAGDSRLIPQLYLFNDNTGKAALKLSVGLFRLVCSNGLTVGMPGLSFETRIRHTWSEAQRGKVLDLPLVAEQIVEHIRTDLLDSIEVAKDTHVRNAIEVVASLPIGERAKEQAISMIAFESERPEDDVGTAWGLYNHVNECVRSRSRSEFTAARKDEGLLSHIITLAAA